MKSLILLLFLLVLFTVFRSTSYAQSTTERVTIETKTVAIPSGAIQPAAGFSVAYGVESRLDLTPAPVKVVANVSRPEDGIGMSRVLIENVSEPDVVGIKLHWYLFDDENSKSFIKEGETSRIKVDHLAAHKQKEVMSGLPKFDEMFKGVAKNGFISGSYFLEAVVSEVLFADGTKWKLPAPSKEHF